jgi:hypothetical protein
MEVAKFILILTSGVRPTVVPKARRGAGGGVELSEDGGDA